MRASAFPSLPSSNTTHSDGDPQPQMGSGKGNIPHAVGGGVEIM